MTSEGRYLAGLIDVDWPTASEDLAGLGFLSRVGTLGPYRPGHRDSGDEASGEPVVNTSIAECDLVVVDLARPSAPAGRGSFVYSPKDCVSYYWHSRSAGDVDARPVGAARYVDTISRVLASPAALLVVCDAPVHAAGVVGYRTGVFSPPFTVENTWDSSTWDFMRLPGFDVQMVRSATGNRIDIECGTPFETLLVRHRSRSFYTCELPDSDGAVPLALNHLGNAVAAWIRPAGRVRAHVVLVHRIADVPAFVMGFAQTVLPELLPNRFRALAPDVWFEEPGIAPRALRQLVQQREALRTDYEIRRRDVDSRVVEEKGHVGDLVDLLAADGRPLEIAVQKAFERLGLTVLKAASDTQEGSEDIQLDLTSFVALVEVTGCLGLPNEDKVLCPIKYVSVRHAETPGVQFRGMTVVNHERGKRPSERQPDPFTPTVREAAIKHHLGLVTTTSLYRLVLSAEVNGWDIITTKAVLSESGIISHIPAWYHSAGRIVHVYPQAPAIVVDLDGALTRVGDRLSIDTSPDVFEFDVTSLQVDDEQVDECSSGEVGIAVPADVVPRLRKGQSVFLATCPSQTG